MNEDGKIGSNKCYTAWSDTTAEGVMQEDKSHAPVGVHACVRVHVRVTVLQQLLHSAWRAPPSIARGFEDNRNCILSTLRLTTLCQRETYHSFWAGMVHRGPIFGCMIPDILSVAVRKGSLVLTRSRTDHTCEALVRGRKWRHG